MFTYEPKTEIEIVRSRVNMVKIEDVEGKLEKILRDVEGKLEKILRSAGRTEMKMSKDD